MSKLNVLELIKRLYEQPNGNIELAQEDATFMDVIRNQIGNGDVDTVVITFANGQELELNAKARRELGCVLMIGVSSTKGPEQFILAIGNSSANHLKGFVDAGLKQIRRIKGLNGVMSAIKHSLSDMGLGVLAPDLPDEKIPQELFAEIRKQFSELPEHEREAMIRDFISKFNTGRKDDLADLKPSDTTH